MNKNIRLGNDIVDLTQPDCRDKYQDQRFLDRIFTPPEKNCIINADNPDKALWSIWAAKEAGYKACKKNDPTLFFFHKKFSLSRDTLLQLQESAGCSDLVGIMHYQDCEITIKFQWYSDQCVHCMGLLLGNDSSQFDWSCLHTSVKKREGLVNYKNQSLEVRRLATELFSELEMGDDLVVARNERLVNGRLYLLPPYLQKNGEPLTCSEVSLSHDGSWLAVALLQAS